MRRPGYGVGWPSVTAILAPLLDSAVYGRALAVRPGFTSPSYGGLFDVGMHDSTGEDGTRPYGLPVLP